MNAAENVAYQRLTFLQLTGALGSINPPAVNMPGTTAGFICLEGPSNPWSGVQYRFIPGEQ
jgi:hypothetical protein